MPLQRLVAYGPPGSSISIGPTSLDLPAWVQAVGSIAAIMIAIWLSRSAERKRDLERIGDHACFASYVQKFLDSISTTITGIAASIDEHRMGDQDRDPPTLATLCSEAFGSYDNLVVERVRKFVELPLTDWPDIEFANAFYDASLQMRADLALLRSTTSEWVAKEVDDEARRLRTEEADRQYRARRVIEEEDEAERFLGDQDDDQVIALPPRGTRRSFVSQLIHNQADEDDDSEYEFQRAIAREEEMDAYIAKAEITAQTRQDRETLDSRVFSKLRRITEKWASTDAPLHVAIQRHQERAIAAGVRLTYAERAAERGLIEQWRLKSHRRKNIRAVTAATSEV